MPNSFDYSQTSLRSESVSGLKWTVHLARQDKRKLLVTVLACLFAASVGYFFLRNPFPIVITIAVFLMAISDFLLPVTYRVNARGASSTSLLFCKQISWEGVKACYLDDLGIKLSSIGLPSKREAYHGVYLRFRDNQEQVIEAVKALRKTTDD